MTERYSESYEDRDGVVSMMPATGWVLKRTNGAVDPLIGWAQMRSGRVLPLIWDGYVKALIQLLPSDRIVNVDHVSAK